jgi:hypothetical protein
MEYLIKEEKLLLEYHPGKGAWTYHIKIPNTKQIKSRWGFLKVSGTIDHYHIESKNLMSLKGQDKMLAINELIRKGIGKTGGDFVTVTLQIDSAKKTKNDSYVLDCFRDAGVLPKFELLKEKEKTEIIKNILDQPDEDQQVGKILFYIKKLT